MNFLFEGIQLFDPINQKYEKFIVFLWTILADSPERNSLTCTMNYNANQGCFHCDFSLRENNFLFNGVGTPKNFHQYLAYGEKLRSMCWDYDCRAPGATLKAIESLQSQSGFKFVKTDERSADKDREKKYLVDYFQESPLVVLDQVKMKLFDFNNVVIAPFHTIHIGVLLVIIPWILELIPEASLAEVLAKHKLPTDVKSWKKDNFDKFLDELEDFCNLIPDSRKKERSLAFFKIIWRIWNDPEVNFDDYHKSKRDFFSAFASKNMDAQSRPKFHYLDHIVLQIPQTGPVRMKNEVSGEAHHLIMKRCTKNTTPSRKYYETCQNRHREWVMDMMGVEYGFEDRE